MARRSKQERLSAPPGWRLPEQQSGETSGPRSKPIEEMSLEELQAEHKRLEWEQAKADIERMVEKQRAREGEVQFGLASNQRRYFGEFLKPRKPWR
jgi:hypothetical protein